MWGEANGECLGRVLQTFRSTTLPPGSDLPQRVEQHRDVDKKLPEQAPTPLRFAKEQTDKVVQAKREQEAELEEAANEEPAKRSRRNGRRPSWTASRLASPTRFDQG